MIHRHHDPAWGCLARLIRPQRRRLAAAAALAVLASAGDIVPLALLARSAQMVLSGPDGSDLAGLAVAMAAALAAKHAAYSAAYALSHVAAFAILADTRHRLARHLAWAPLPWLHRQGSGPLKTVVLHDVERLEQFIAHHSVECVAATAAPLLVAALLCWIDGWIALAALGTVPVAMLAQWTLMRGLAPQIEAVNRAGAEISGATVEYIRSIPVMRLYRQTTASFHRLRDGLARYHALIEGVTRRTVPGWSAFVVLLGANIALLLPVGLWRFQHGALPLDQMILVLIIGSGMLKPVVKLARFGSEIGEIRAGLHRIEPVLRWPAPARHPPAALPAAAALEIDRIGLRLDGRTILDDISLTLPPGSLTALVGPSGAGKSTLAHLLAGLIEPTGGTIRYGGHDLDRLDESQRRRLVTVAAQDAFLFQGTLLDNLRLGRPDADMAAVRRAAAAAQIDTFISGLPEGYLTVIGERGARLSGGERQRVALARALLTASPVLVLDEATAFADSLTEKRFHHALRAVCPDRAILVIAHRLTAIAQADRIAVIDQGRLIDLGRHDELMPRCPLYHALWHRQFDCDGWTLRAGEPAHAAHS